MTKADLERFRNILLALRVRLAGDVSHLEDETIRHRDGQDTARLSGASDVADKGSDLYEYDLDLSLIQNQEHTIEEIDEALERIGKGDFGRCEECRTPIPRQRLQALPYTRHCVSCARKLQ